MRYAASPITVPPSPVRRFCCCPLITQRYKILLACGVMPAGSERGRWYSTEDIMIVIPGMVSESFPRKGDDPSVSTNIWDVLNCSVLYCSVLYCY